MPNLELSENLLLSLQMHFSLASLISFVRKTSAGGIQAAFRTFVHCKKSFCKGEYCNRCGNGETYVLQ